MVPSAKVEYSLLLDTLRVSNIDSVSPSTASLSALFSDARVLRVLSFAQTTKYSEPSWISAAVIHRVVWRKGNHGIGCASSPYRNRLVTSEFGIVWNKFEVHEFFSINLPDTAVPLLYISIAVDYFN